MAKVETEGFEKAIAQTEQLADNLEDNMADYVDDEVHKLRRKIVQNIHEDGLIDTGELVNSFVVERKGNTWEVYSTEDHAKYLEEGTPPHDIYPDDKEMLAFVPEDPSKYGGNYDEETGYVFLEMVKHPGNQPYRFVENAQWAWEAGLAIGLRQAVRKEILKAGFTL